MPVKIVKETARNEKPVRKAPPKKSAPKAVPAGYKMLKTAVHGGTNLTDSLLVGAYKDVAGRLDGVPFSTVKGVYVDADGGVSAHVYVTGRDGAETLTDKQFASAFRKALGASKTERHPTAAVAEGSKAKNFAVYGIDINPDDYEVLSVGDID